MKLLLSRIKPYLRWFVLGATIFFLVATLRDRAAEATEVRIAASGWIDLAIAFFVTLLAHIWSSWVWVQIFKTLGRSIPVQWGMRVYLKTNIAKYLPGNVWHFTGRIVALKKTDMPVGMAVFGTLLEPLLMAAAALIVAVAGSPFVDDIPIVIYIILPGVLLGLHPRCLDPIVRRLAKGKLRKIETEDNNISPASLYRYPLVPLLGELGFLLCRGAGFIFALLAVSAVGWDRVPLLLSAFSVAWLLGLAVPGAPGGIGVFEATAVALLLDRVPSGAILAAIVLYRLISILAEAVAAGLAVLWETQVSNNVPGNKPRQK